MADTQTSIFTRMTALAEQTRSVNLGQGFPDWSGPSEVIEAAVAALRAGHNQYAPLPGIPSLRRAVAEHQLRRYGIELDPDREIQVTFGATEALASALLALLGTRGRGGVPGPGLRRLSRDRGARRRADEADRAGAARLARDRGGDRGGDRAAHARAPAELAPQPHRPRAGPGRARAARVRVPGA